MSCKEWQRALHLLGRMPRYSIAPDNVAITSVISACATAACWFFTESEREPFFPEWSCLLHPSTLEKMSSRILNIPTSLQVGILSSQIRWVLFEHCRDESPSKFFFLPTREGALVLFHRSRRRYPGGPWWLREKVLRPLTAGDAVMLSATAAACRGLWKAGHQQVFGQPCVHHDEGVPCSSRSRLVAQVRKR